MKAKENAKTKSKIDDLFPIKVPKKTLSCRLSVECLDLLKKASTKHGVSISEIIEGCVKHTLKD